jgi:hypothetical protein
VHAEFLRGGASRVVDIVVGERKKDE